MSLDIQIKVDPGASAAAADKVTASLHKTEDEGIATKKAMDNLNGTFARLAKVLENDMKRAAEQARASQDALSKSLTAGGKAFDGMTAAIAREQAMLERIHGPAKQYQQDLEVLNKLQRDGKISAEQHAAALAKSASGAGAGPSKGLGQFKEKILGGSTGGAIAGGVLGGLIGGNVVGLLTQGIGSLIDKWGEHDRAVAESTKTLRGQFESMNAVTRAVELQDAAAARLGVSLKAQTEAFASVQTVAERFYLTTLETTKATETLGNIALNAGRDLKTVSTFIDGLGKSLEDGKVSSSEFQSLVKTFPEAVDKWAQSLGVGREELARLASSGKLTTTQVEAYFNVLRDGAGVQKRTVEGLGGMVHALKTAGDAAETLGDTIEDVFAKYRRATDEMNKRLTSNIAGGLEAISTLAGGAWGAANRLFHDKWGDSALDKGLKQIVHGAKEATAAIAELRNYLDTVSQSGATAGYKISRPQDILLEGDRSVRGGEGPSANSMDFPSHEQIVASANAPNPLKDLNEEASELNRMIGGQLVDSARSFSSALVDAANGAEMSWADFGRSTLVMFEKMIAQALILQAITGSASGAAGKDGGYGGLLGALGFATGGGALMTSGGLQRIPGAATGMDAIIGGAGSTDSRLAVIRATPGESLHVRTPEQRAAAARGGGGGTVVNNNVSFDPRALLAVNGSTAGQQSIVNAVVINADVIRRALGVR